MKRFRQPKAKPGQLKVQWGKLNGDDPDLVFAYGGAGAQGCDSRLLYYYFCSKKVTGNEIELSLFEELEKRGYDMTTFKFSIERKKEGKL